MRSRSRWMMAAALAWAVAAGCRGARAGNLDAAGGGTEAANGAAAGAAPGAASAGEWTMPARDYSSTRFSPLAQITAANAPRLRLAWSFSTGAVHGHEGTPLVVGNTMYLVTPYPNVAYALDLTKPGPVLKWKYDPHPDPMAVGKACCDIVNRGWAYADGKLVYNLLDSHTVALDAATGKELWRTKVAEVRDGITMTMAPLIARGKVYVGNSGGEMGAQGMLAALDLSTGKILWRAYSTGPDSMVKIGPRFRPFYSWLKGKDLGLTTWPADAWRHGAGAVWGWISYDPALNLIYYGTSNPGPWNQEQRPGLNLFTSSVFARDPDTGEAVWAYQYTPHDEWDYDGTNENILVDLPLGGRTRHALVHFNRNGFAYVLDRATGEVLSARPFGYLNWATGVDLRTGKPNVVPEKTTHAGVWTRDVCPPDIGVKDQQPASYSPRTGLFYVPTNHLCMDYLTHHTSYIAGTPYWATNIKRRPAPGGYRGSLMAWDPVHARKVWEIPDTFIVYSGTLVTAGDVVFYGTVGGWFRAVDARSGKIVWQQKLGSGIISGPMTYLGPDGRQYVAVIAGVGGAANTQKDVPGFPADGGELYVFSLDGVNGSGTGESGAPAASGSQNPQQSGERGGVSGPPADRQ